MASETQAQILTTQKVISVLRRGGFTKSESIESRMVRGWSTPTCGFRVTIWQGSASDGYARMIRVTHRLDGYARSDADRAQMREWCSKYADVLEAAGLSVNRGDPANLEVSYPCPT